MAFMAEEFVYLDNAASMKPEPAAVELAAKFSLNYYANPNSIHDFGIECETYLERARRQILALLVPNDDSVNTFECLFTSGATEGNNIALLGAAKAKENYAKRVITTTAEHASVAQVCALLADQGYEIIKIPVALNGNIDWDLYEAALNKPVAAISAMAVCHQNGAILPLAKMAALAKKKQPRALFHTDATQAIGKLSLRFDNIDLVTFSGHKLGGLRGTGALLKRAKVSLSPTVVGGGQEYGLRPGTHNVPGDLALALALRLALSSLAERTRQAQLCNQKIRAGLQNYDEFCMLASPENSCLPFVLTICLKQQKASVMDQFLSSKGIFVSTTSACDDKNDEPNEILRAMGLKPSWADNPIRLSFTGREEMAAVERFLASFIEGLQNLHTATGA